MDDPRQSRTSPTLFLCHSSADKAFVRMLAYSLELHGVNVWLDEAEIRVGQSLIATISSAIESIQYLLVVLSPASVNSQWVKQELEAAMTLSLSKGTPALLPVLYRDCAIPAFLSGKKYADFRDPAAFGSSLNEVLRALPLPVERGNPRIVIPVSSGRSTAGAPLLDIRDLNVTIDFQEKVRGISFSVAKGQVVGLIGPSSAGKTATCRALSGDRPRSWRVSGRLHWAESSETPAISQTVGIPCPQIQLVSPFPRRRRLMRGPSVRRYIESTLEPNQRTTDAAIHLLRRVGVWEIIQEMYDDPIADLAPIFQLRILLAVAIARRPRLLILDHVLDFFSPINVLDILSPLFQLSSEGVSIIIADSDFSLLCPWIDLCVLLYFGKVIAIGSPTEIALSEHKAHLGFHEMFLTTVEGSLRDARGLSPNPSLQRRSTGHSPG